MDRLSEAFNSFGVAAVLQASRATTIFTVADTSHEAMKRGRSPAGDEMGS
jgi:hypothetical protein